MTIRMHERTLHDYKRQLIALARQLGALRFGEFTLKSGRVSPYFFNAGRFSTGRAIALLGRCYAETLVRSGLPFDMLFGPAYKGIPLVAATAGALAEHHSRDVAFAFNRKEAKDHGEGGTIIGSTLEGRVLIVDDVITAGTAVRESVQVIRSAGATLAGVLLALDRQERGIGGQSAVQEVQEQFGVPCVSIITLADLIDALAPGNVDAEADPAGGPGSAAALAALQQYRARYGV